MLNRRPTRVVLEDFGTLLVNILVLSEKGRPSRAELFDDVTEQLLEADLPEGTLETTIALDIPFDCSCTGPELPSTEELANMLMADWQRRGREYGKEKRWRPADKEAAAQFDKEYARFSETRTQCIAHFVAGWEQQQRLNQHATEEAVYDRASH